MPLYADGVRRILVPDLLCPSPGKLAVFKAKVMGNPTPKVSWGRANGEIVFHPETCQQKFDEVSGEHTLEVSLHIETHRIEAELLINRPKIIEKLGFS